MSMDMVAQIRRALERELTPVSIDVIDDSAKHAGHAGARQGGHFRVTVVSKAFVGRTALERHRLVYAAVADLMSDGIHAMSLDTRSPDEIDELS